MKKILVGAAASLAVCNAFAQSTVTLYGLIDTEVRYITHARAGGGGQLTMGTGEFSGARFGLKGTEDLGGGNFAVFTLENAFNPTTGAIGMQGQMFARQAYVGLSNKDFGEIDAGRQLSAFAQIMQPFEANGWGSFSEQTVEGGPMGLRFDNSLQYSKIFGPVSLRAQYSVGGQPGAISVGATEGLAAVYAQNSLSAGGALQHSKDANSHGEWEFGLGGSYIVGPAKILVSYMMAKRDPGFAAGTNSTAAAPSSAPLANTGFLSNAGNTRTRTDQIFTLGGLFQINPFWTIIAGYQRDNISNEDSLGNSGRYEDLYVIADYALSKRTEVYVQADESKLSGLEFTKGSIAGTFGGYSNRFGVGAGIRVKF
jgi:predicted porin